MSIGCGESLRRKLNLQAKELSEGFLMARVLEAEERYDDLIEALELLCDVWQDRIDLLGRFEDCIYPDQEMVWELKTVIKEMKNVSDT